MTDATTLLVLSGAGVPPYSARGLTQDLTYINASVAMRRTVNGTLTDVSDPNFRKYASKITCTDQQAPALSGIWPGMVLTVDCVNELSFYAGTDSTDEPDSIDGRTVVPGSGYFADGFFFYRPRLTMMVTKYWPQQDEYGATVAWELDLEEV